MKAGFGLSLPLSVLILLASSRAESVIEVQAPTTKRSLRLRVTLEPQIFIEDILRWAASPRISALQYGGLAACGHYYIPLKFAKVEVLPAEKQVAKADAQSDDVDSKRLGLDGYCPVTLQNEQRWVLGNKEFELEHAEQVFRFAGEVEKNQFEENPAEFAPVAQGTDVVLLVDQGQTIPGHRRHGIFYRSNVYLFSSEKTLEKFGTDPEFYRKAMAKPEIQTKKRVQPEQQVDRYGLQQQDTKPQPTAVNGYCLVTFSERQNWVLGREDVTADYEGTLYRFAGEREKEIFEWNPEPFVPAAAGNDVVLLTEAKECVQGNRRQSVWYRDHLYLFENDRTREKFEGHPEKYVHAKVSMAMPAQEQVRGTCLHGLWDKQMDLFKGLDFDLKKPAEESK